MARPFHFTTDPFSLWTAVDRSGSSTWVQAGSDLTAKDGLWDGILRRDNDTSNNATVEARQKHSWLKDGEDFGVVCNVQGTTQFYLWVRQRFINNKVRLFQFNSGFTQLSDKTKTYTGGTYVRMKITSLDNGSNKDLEGFIDGVSEATATTSLKLGAGNGGIEARVDNVNTTMDVDWWVMDPAITVTSVDIPRGDPSGGEPRVITGVDIGDGSIAEFGGTNATNNVATPNTSLACDTPAHDVGLVDVKVKFGTAGVEEFFGVLVNGFTYGGLRKLINQSMTLGKRLISSSGS